jgi:hypothetical protein
MKRNKFVIPLVLAGTIFISASFIHAQGTQLLYNKSFENGTDPEGCLTYYSGGTNTGISFDEEEPTNLFGTRTNWVSNWAWDIDDCNMPYVPCTYYDPDNPPVYMCTDDWYVHSPDLVGGAGNCYNAAWDQDYACGMAAYEVTWQDFVGTTSNYLHTDKSYEVRIKVFLGTTNGSIGDKSLCVMLGTQAFNYQRIEQGFWDPLDDVDQSLHCCLGNGDSGSDCAQCDSKYRGFNISGTEDIRMMKRFPISDIEDDNYGSYSYGKWYELHFKMKMSDYNFTNPLFPINEFVQFGLDIRDPYELDNSDNRQLCLGPYVLIDQVEFFEWCPEHYDIYGAMIGGTQSEYAAQTSITAGMVDVTKGPSIVTSTGKTEFIAGHFVELIPGFLADAGAVLTISVDPDFNCTNYRSLSIDQPFTEADRKEADRDPELKIGPDPTNEISAVNVFPNPTSGVCTIKLQGQKITSITIYDNIGKSVMMIDAINMQEFAIDISKLESGNYSLVITTSNGEIYREKLIKV